VYQCINKNIDNLLDEIGHEHVKDYEFLLNELSSINVAKDINYQTKYRTFWVMRYISPDSDFNTKYFEFLENNKNKKSVTLDEVCTHFNGVTTDKAGKYSSFQFSFISKLMHMINGTFPIYDSKVRDFYFIPISSDNNFEKKRKNANGLIYYLIQEQKKAIACKEIKSAMNKFKNRFSPHNFSDEKILDSLIWGYVKYREKKIKQYIIDNVVIFNKK